MAGQKGLVEEESSGMRGGERERMGERGSERRGESNSPIPG